MNLPMVQPHEFLADLLALSARGSAVLLVVLAVQIFLRRWLPAGFRHALWALVGLRLALPELPTSPLSLFGLSSAFEAAGEAPVGVLLPAGELPAGIAEGAALVGGGSPGALLPIGLFTLWAAVGLALLGRLALSRFDLAALVRRARPVTSPEGLALLDQSRRLFGIRSAVRLLETPEIEGPATCGGVARPAILLPPGFFDSLLPAQQRHALLHELAHLRRLDSIWLLVAQILAAVHWFNPLIWLALRRFRSDLEMACDATVLTRLAAEDRRGYGRTLLEVGVQPTLAATLMPGFAVASKQQLIRRIQMISRFQSSTKKRAAWLLVLAAILVAATLTSAKTSGPSSAEEVATQFADLIEDPEARATSHPASWVTKVLQSGRFTTAGIEAAFEAEAQRR
ncbi:MAG: M56 family metallopeptidase, partial [Acidobacteriota bacterium]